MHMLTIKIAFCTLMLFFITLKNGAVYKRVKETLTSKMLLHRDLRRILTVAFIIILIILYLMYSLNSEYCPPDPFGDKVFQNIVENSGFIDSTLNDLEQDDPRLIEAIKTRFLVRPPNRNFSKLHLSGPNPKLDGQFGQPLEIDKLWRYAETVLNVF